MIFILILISLLCGYLRLILIYLFTAQRKEIEGLLRDLRDETNHSRKNLNSIVLNYFDYICQKELHMLEIIKL